MDGDQIFKRLFATGQPTRREFLAQTTALGISAAAAATLWSKRAQAAPKKGGHLRIATDGASTSDSLDATAFSDTFMINLGYSTRGNLTGVASDGSLAPGLAESWEASADASSWVFKLRKGVEFSNGKSLEVGDVVTSINAHLGEKSKSGAKGLLAGITGIKADGRTPCASTFPREAPTFPISWPTTI